MPCYDLLNNFSAQPMRLHGLFFMLPLHPFPDSGVFTGKDKKRVVATSPVKFEPIAEMNSVISGISRSVKVTASLNKSYSVVTKAYNKK